MGSGSEILVVEDSRIQAEALKRFLSGRGFSVALAEDGAIALEKLRGGYQPAIILSDIEMPRMNGYELCSTLKQDETLSLIPVVLLTALSDPRDVVEGLNSGADGYVTKPYNETLLLSRITALCARPVELRKAVEGEEASVAVGDENFTVRASFRQALDLLVSTYENAVEQNRQLQEATHELSNKNSELEELLTLKNRLLGMAAHDLRNPLYAINGYGEHLLKSFSERASKRERDMCEGIVRSSDFMAKLIDDLLTVVSQEAGQVDLVPVEVDLLRVIEQQVNLTKLLAEDKSIEIIFERTPEPLPVRCDENKISQVISNLVSNAIKYSHSGTTVTVRCFREEGVARVAVEDQGQGIPEGEVEKLFQPFSRTSVTPTGGERSTGLGLAICKNIIDAHKGAISVESKASEGSIFSFILPL